MFKDQQKPLKTPLLNSQNFDCIRTAFHSFIRHSPVLEPVPAFMIGDIKTLEKNGDADACDKNLSDMIFASGLGDYIVKTWDGETCTPLP